MGIMYLKLLGAGMLPAAVSVIFFYLRKKTKFENLREDLKQLVIGVAFGVCAVISTNHGVDVTGATANARDAAPLCAGLLFGGQAGIIAGLIGEGESQIKGVKYILRGYERIDEKLSALGAKITRLSGSEDPPSY